MKGRSFDTFQMAPGNQEAFTVCRRIALLEEMGPALIVLLGPEGCGKSHLLWAIAKQVRASTLPAGLALLTPDDIPEKVRGLVENSAPLQGRRAILLVDGLEHFDAEVRRLDAIIEVFLACQHPVIVATSVHPNRLERLSVPLVNRLSKARFVEMEARLPVGDADTADRVRSLEEAARELQRQRDLLKDQLAAAEALCEEVEQTAVLAEAGAAEARKQAELAETERDAMRVARDQARAEIAAVESRALEQHSEAEKARSAWHTVARALEEMAGVKESLEGQLAAAEGEAAYALAQQARLQGQLVAYRLEAEKVSSLQASRDEAERAIAQAIEALESMRSQHLVLCDDLATDIKGVVDDLDMARAEPVSARDQEGRLSAVLADAKRVQEEVTSALVATRGRLKAVEFEWAKSRKVLAIQTAEMDALRYAAASQVAQANIQAGELEHRVGLLEAALDSLRANRPEAGTEAGAAGKTWSMALENMQAQLAALREARSGKDGFGALDEQVLFESDFFEALPTDFEGHHGGNARPPLPGLGAELRDALDGALGGGQNELPGNEEDASIDISG